MAAQRPFRNDRILSDWENASRLFAPLSRERVEIAAFAYLAADRRMLALRYTRSRRADLVDLPLRRIVSDALAFGASGLVIGHNHPRGSSAPSRADIDATRLLARTLRPLEIAVLDHLVVASDGIASFRVMGLL
ncbi:JAB domain-containing protein [Sphingomonas sp. ac-8]|uniref:JAB domain-containing protein n=1 Tax=Sphingomonas sp. ac-8 TaxID=3242977 RepID=UPI003A7FE5C8